MEELLTRKGVLIDTCSHCKGVWLDQGELNFFAKDKKPLRNYALKGLEKNKKQIANAQDVIQRCSQVAFPPTPFR